ncbi:MAG: hypothetical protein GEV07_15430 [Streptosporangiales bacterium]|nr:hypothetical protein [Streptosporangiales bacterium]
MIREQELAGLDIVTDGQMYFDDYGGSINLALHVHYDLPGCHYTNQRYLTEDLVPVFNAELKELVAAGATFIQLEDLGAWLPIMSGDKDDARYVVDVMNRTFDGVDAKLAWHCCLGAAYGSSNQSLWGGQLKQIMQPLYDVAVDQFVLGFSLRDMADVDVLRTLPEDKEVAAGVIDVRTTEVESASARCSTTCRLSGCTSPPTAACACCRG